MDLVASPRTWNRTARRQHRAPRFCPAASVSGASLSSGRDLRVLADVIPHVVVKLAGLVLLDLIYLQITGNRELSIRDSFGGTEKVSGKPSRDLD